MAAARDGASRPPAPPNPVCSPPAAGSAPAARRGGFPSACGVDGVGCIIDNAVIYLCFLGYIANSSAFLS